MENKDIEYDYKSLCELHKLTTEKIVYNPGFIRTTPVNIGGTDWKPQISIESKIKEELTSLLDQKEKSKTEIAIEIMLCIIRRQIFLDGSKRRDCYLLIRL